METTEVAIVQESLQILLTAPSAVTPIPPAVVEPPPEVIEVAYVVELPAWGDFPVVKSPNAWWMNTQKVALLFDAYKAGATDEMACINANISIGQLRYFKLQHPDFLQAKEACKSVGLAKFMNGLHTEGPKDLPTIRWYLSKMHPDFKPKDKVDPTPAPVQQSVNVQVNTHVDTAKIEDILARAAERFVTDGPGESSLPADGGQSVAEGSQG